MTRRPYGNDVQKYSSRKVGSSESVSRRVSQEETGGLDFRVHRQGRKGKIE